MFTGCVLHASDHVYLVGMWFPILFSRVFPNTRSLTDKHAGTPMGITAENLAEKYGISREVCDCVALILLSSKLINMRLDSFALIYVLTLDDDGINICHSKDCDVHAIRSQQTWGQAQKAGVFDLEMAPVEVKTKKGAQVRN